MNNCNFKSKGEKAMPVILLALLAASFGARGEESMGFVTLTGGTRELNGGTVYTVGGDVTIAAPACENALTAKKTSDTPSGRRIVIDIPEGRTLTVRGGNANGVTGAGAGIALPADMTLYVTGKGRLVAAGGNAARGGDGSAGGDARYRSVAYHTAGSGGGGGYGGGGAGAGIGGRGGNGGVGGAGALAQTGYWSVDTFNLFVDEVATGDQAANGEGRVLIEYPKLFPAEGGSVMVCGRMEDMSGWPAKKVNDIVSLYASQKSFDGTGTLPGRGAAYAYDYYGDQYLEVIYDSYLPIKGVPNVYIEYSLGFEFSVDTTIEDALKQIEPYDDAAKKVHYSVEWDYRIKEEPEETNEPVVIGDGKLAPEDLDPAAVTVKDDGTVLTLNGDATAEMGDSSTESVTVKFTSTSGRTIEKTYPYLAA